MGKYLGPEEIIRKKSGYMTRGIAEEGEKNEYKYGWSTCQRENI